MLCYVSFNGMIVTLIGIALVVCANEGRYLSDKLT